MKLIRLSKRQTATTRVSNPIFELQIIKSDKENKELILKYLDGPTDELKEEIILTNLHLIRHTVGRYLSHWAETKRWEDDMVSVGLQSLLTSLEKLTIKQAHYFRPWAVCRIKHDIETFVNGNKTAVSASLSTDYRRLRNGQPLATKPEVSLSDDNDFLASFTPTDSLPTDHFKTKRIWTKRELMKLFKVQRLPDDFPSPISKNKYKSSDVEAWLLDQANKAGLPSASVDGILKH